jgi:hypothetical protein
MQTYDRAKVEAAFANLPAKADNPTMLQQGLYNLYPILEKLSGKTKVFIFTDGTYTKMESITQKPSEIGKDLAEKYDNAEAIRNRERSGRKVRRIFLPDQQTRGQECRKGTE